MVGILAILHTIVYVGVVVALPYLRRGQKSSNFQLGLFDVWAFFPHCPFFDTSTGATCKDKLFNYNNDNKCLVYKEYILRSRSRPLLYFIDYILYIFIS